MTLGGWRFSIIQEHHKKIHSDKFLFVMLLLGPALRTMRHVFTGQQPLRPSALALDVLGPNLSAFR